MCGAIIGDIAGSIFEFEQVKKVANVEVKNLIEFEGDVINNSRLATIPSHNSKDAIEAAEKMALIIFYARKGLSKDEIIDKLNIKLRYIPFERFNSTCNVIERGYRKIEKKRNEVER